MARKRNLYDPHAEKPFRLSRTKIDLFVNCPRCFYLDRRLGVSRPPGFPFNLNSAVDTLLKNEFDHYRDTEKAHPLMIENGVHAIPFQHEDLRRWRSNFKGVSYLDKGKNLEFFGAVDDLWIDDASGEIIVVDYKATSKNGEVSLDADWQISYKRQMEFYQWLLRQNGFSVANTGYFVYCNGVRDRERFDARLDFTIKVLPYTGSDHWIGDVIEEAHKTLNGTSIPSPAEKCEFCNYVSEANDIGAPSP
jgi:CRISPR/Cas system-associated exonuclease Cas4 (RecB family)